jgi:hypothetical protein
MISVKIMATPKRTKYLSSMLKSLKLDKSIVVFDDRKKGGDAMYNARRCWLSPLEHNQVTHRLVLQDDLELVDNFLDIVKQALDSFPDAIWSLYSSRIYYEDRESDDTPYLSIKGNGVHGQAIIIPVKYIKDCFNWIDETLGFDYPHDDCAIGTYANVKNIPVYTTIPSLVQHLAPNESALKYNNKNKISKVYEGKDVSHIDWTNKKVYETKRVIKNSLPIYKE